MIDKSYIGRLLASILGGAAAPGAPRPTVTRPAKHGAKARIEPGRPCRGAAVLCPECHRPLRRRLTSGRRTDRYYDRTARRVICSHCAESADRAGCAS